MKNLITDVAGVLVGNAEDMRAATGATVAIFDGGAAASVATLGGAPGSRMVTSLEPEMVRGNVDAVALSGGSVAMASTRRAAPRRCCARRVAARLSGHHRSRGGSGDPVRPGQWQRQADGCANRRWSGSLCWDLGRDAALAAGATSRARHGRSGRGGHDRRLERRIGLDQCEDQPRLHRRRTGRGQRCWRRDDRCRPHSGQVLCERDGEFGGKGWPARLPDDALSIRFKGQPVQATATTIALVATDARLSKAECKRPAIMANDGLGKSLRPVHAPNDGDTVFAAATGRAEALGDAADPKVMTEPGTVAADRSRHRAAGTRRLRGDGVAVRECVARLEDALRRPLLMMGYLVVFVGAGTGGAARHGMNIWVARPMGSHFPWHTLVINILGSLAMGLVAGFFMGKSDAT